MGKVISKGVKLHFLQKNREICGIRRFNRPLLWIKILSPTEGWGFPFTEPKRLVQGFTI
jgi:hypothetical protein